MWSGAVDRTPFVTFVTLAPFCLMFDTRNCLNRSAQSPATVRLWPGGSTIQMVLDD